MCEEGVGTLEYAIESMRFSSSDTGANRRPESTRKPRWSYAGESLMVSVEHTTLVPATTTNIATHESGARQTRTPGTETAMTRWETSQKDRAQCEEYR